MAIRVVEIHHQGIRIDGDEAALAANLQFYQGLLGLTPDSARPAFPGIPGFWMNVGEVGQIHLIGGDQPSPFAQGPDKDPVAPHIALAVADVAETIEWACDTDESMVIDFRVEREVNVFPMVPQGKGIGEMLLHAPEPVPVAV